MALPWIITHLLNGWGITVSPDAPKGFLQDADGNRSSKRLLSSCAAVLLFTGWLWAFYSHSQPSDAFVYTLGGIVVAGIFGSTLEGVGRRP